MEELRSRSALIGVLLVVAFFMALHGTLGAENITVEKTYSEQPDRYFNDSPIIHPDDVNIAQEEIDDPYIYEEDMINVEDVFYVAIYTNMAYVEFLDEGGKLCSLSFLIFLQNFSKHLQKKRLIWIYIVQETKRYSDHLGTVTHIKNLLANNIKKKHVVIDPIKNTKYNLYVDPAQEKDRHINRLRKLDLVWWHILSEQASGYSLTLYNPISTYPMPVAFIEQKLTLIFITLDIFIERSVGFSKAFIVLGIRDKEDYIIAHKKGVNLNDSKNVRTLELFSMLPYMINQFLLKKIENNQYPFLEVDILIKKDYIRFIDSKQMHTSPPISKSADVNSIIHNPELGITPIYFIHTGVQTKNVRCIQFESFLAISHPKIAKIYFNILNRAVNFNQYYITNYSPLYVDFSYYVLNSLHEGCFNEFFSQIEYLLIRDIDCRSLEFLLDYRVYTTFPYIHEIPMDKHKVLKVSSEPLRVYIKNKELKEFFPKMAMKNMVYCYTEHMLFMKSTLRVKEYHKHPKHKIFDVLIFKNPLKEYITIETETETETEEEIGSKNEIKKEEVQEMKDRPNILQVINRLEESRNKSRDKSSLNIILLNYSLITKEKLEEKIKEKENYFISHKRTRIPRTPLSSNYEQVKISEKKEFFLSNTINARLARKKKSFSNSQTETTAKKQNTSLSNSESNAQISINNDVISISSEDDISNQHSTNSFAALQKFEPLSFESRPLSADLTYNPTHTNHFSNAIAHSTNSSRTQSMCPKKKFIEKMMNNACFSTE
ncbi:hypothetical protein NEFER03_0914 [Nematocida sp. LUAm3]|nr:hypothetical protein NEFER03_0914 [Nematocida sp. LUAm3]KAI5174932.1 hypothetical protein NEFER02_1032 [Nematocida sp. LUAm2]KAI5177469.1 hypothetical protein NEFER01_0719 [Nematocida sp. LUAm1]